MAHRARRANQGRKAEDDGEASDGTNRSRGRCAGPVTGGGSTKVDWFGCGCVLGLTSPENNRTCGGIEGGTGQRWRVRTIGRRRHSQPWEMGAGGTDEVVWFGRLEEEDKR